MAASLRELEEQLVLLTDAEKAQLMMKLLPALSHAVAEIGDWLRSVRKQFW